MSHPARSKCDKNCLRKLKCHVAMVTEQLYVTTISAGVPSQNLV